MPAYILDSKTLFIKDLLPFDDYDIQKDINYESQSSIVTNKNPNVEVEDFVAIQTEKGVVLWGIVQSAGAEEGTAGYVVRFGQQENLFNRNIFVGETKIISETGIEDFIVQEIRENFKNNDDPNIDLSYLTVEADTHTRMYVDVKTDNGIYNLMQFLAKCREYYGIFIDFEFAKPKLLIRVHKKSEKTMNLNINDTCFQNYKETFEVSTVAVIKVRWKQPDTEGENDEVIEGPIMDKIYYLLADGKVTENKNAENRVIGKVDALYVEAETEEEVLQNVQDRFAENTYNHKVEFDLVDTMAYPQKEFYIGRKCRIKTKVGLKESVVTAINATGDSEIIHVVLGNLPVTLTEKLRRVRKG